MNFKILKLFGKISQTLESLQISSFPTYHLKVLWERLELEAATLGQNANKRNITKSNNNFKFEFSLIKNHNFQALEVC